MSQDLPSTQHLRDMRNVATLPFPTFKAGAFESTMPPSYTSDPPLQHYSSHYPPFSELFPFLDPQAGMSSRQRIVTEVPNINNTNTNTNQPHCRAYFTSPKEFEGQHSVPAMWPNFSPGYSTLPLLGDTQSRLPPNNVGRKAPRKATTSSPISEISPQSPISSSKLAQRRAAKEAHRLRRGSPLPAWHEHNTPKQNPPTPYALALERTPLNEGQSLPPISARSRRVILGEEEEENDEDDHLFPIATIETGIGRIPTARMPSAFPDTAATDQTHARPHPRFKYPIPKELKRVHQALGEKNWNDYLILTEQKCLGEIFEAQCVARSKAIFAMFDEHSQRRVERQMSRTVVMPVLEQQSKMEVDHK
jgi:hypothetical protein